MAFTTVRNGVTAIADHIQQLIDALSGTAGSGQPISLTTLNSASDYSLDVRNLDSGNRALRVRNSAGTTLIDTAGSALTISGITMGAWTSFTPTFDQGGAVGTSTATGAYAIIGNKTAIVQARLVANAAGTGANNILLASIPAAIAPKSTNLILGVGIYNDTGVVYTLAAVRASASTAHFYGYNTSDEFGVNPAITIASGDTLDVQLAYEIA